MLINHDFKKFALNTTITNGQLTAKINHKGAELISLANHEREFIWEGNPAFWGKHSPILFPIVGTLKNNQFFYKNQTYSLSRHGFARDTMFEVIEKTENTVTFSLISDENTVKIYPFLFELHIIYSLENNQLSIGYQVFNKEKGEMFFSIGAHPAFALPNTFEDYAIVFEQDETLTYYLLENDLLSPKTSTISTKDGKFNLNYPLFENDALIFKHLKSKSLRILQKDKPLLQVDFEGFPHLGIWTKTNAPFICIEPWFGHSDTIDSTGDFTQKEGIQKLGPAEVFSSKFSITIL